MCDEIMKKLQEPFKADEIEWRIGNKSKDGKKATALAYITNRAIQNRLDEVFGCFGWRNEFKEWRGSAQLCGISVKNGDEWITKWDGADDSNVEKVKGGLSDSMKRAAYQWGIGRYLYELDTKWVEINEYGQFKQTPTLPDWALPAGTNNKPNNKGVEKKADLKAVNNDYITAEQKAELKTKLGPAEFAKVMNENGGKLAIDKFNELMKGQAA